MATTRTHRQPSPRAMLGETLRRLAPLAHYTLPAEALRPLVADAGPTGVAAFIAALAYECQCNYRMEADQAVFTKRAPNGL